ncbi:MAG: CoA-acylating methylmalonate-semialdehyde dehydrogenase [Bacteroidetes bacterium]|nr:CoA-acylating methylmalonate-semialdehyde dehydrogenase [Bacteroidota bacterium]MBU1116946.1 CoA-acylating methylmalonate-semialdehyde dehydrogenase [Bacteroidota bacterium]MBU1799119.1 CoA-acylating methylmalonate-semialdehyde dehydrogenase [Bacteroidota bacterium]
MKKLKNYINGEWVESKSPIYLDVDDPGSGEIISQVPAGCKEDIEIASEAASSVFLEWRNTPAEKRIQYLFKMKTILENNADEISTICTKESGKTFAESKAEIVRAVENIEVACGIPTLMQGEFSEDISAGIDEYVIRQPLGVGACIAPFNFPIMITFWFMPYAIASGNTYIVKPSEKVPETMTRIFELFEELNLPKGVLNLVHGGKETVDGILTNPEIKAISFVGSSKIAKYVYAKGTENGKRVQAQGGAKNPVVIMPDADVDTTTNIISDSVFGCAGQRCLAASTVVLVGEAKEQFKEKLINASNSKNTCYGLDKSSQMGAIITKESKERILNIINEAEEKGAKILLDGRNKNVEDYEGGNYLFPTIIENAPIDSEANITEIFGPVMNLKYVDSLDEAIEFINSSKYGNAACIFTSNGSAARKFRHDVIAGNIGVNIGIAAPMAFFPFSGWKESFFGDLHGQSNHAVEFYTQTKVVIERWYSEWTRKF